MDKLGGLVLTGLLVAPMLAPVPVAVQMISMSVATIFFGSARAWKREKERKEGGDAAEPRDVISGSQVYRFPIMASVTLVSLFLAFKYLPNEIVSVILTGGSSFLGVCAVGNIILPLLEGAFPAWKKKTVGLHDPFVIDALELVSIVIASPLGFWYARTKHFLANNVLGTALAYTAVEFLGLEDFKSGAILLAGLFFYDIFWVFYSKDVFGDNVMVTVAKKFEGPIKLIFPKFPGAGKENQSMLGLGDIVIPGIFVALMFRFDEHLVPANGSLSLKKKPYFWSVITSYFAGLATTYVMMAVFNHAQMGLFPPYKQPALLYLVPACLLSSFGCATIRRQLPQLLEYSEAEPEKAKEQRPKSD